MGIIIGITTHTREKDGTTTDYESATAYTRAVIAAGGTPVLLPHALEKVEDYLALCDGFVFSGGNDPDMSVFGKTTHPKATVMNPARQRFELALLDALRDQQPATPCLGICLGMQMMSLHAGGDLNQCIAETHNDPAMHDKSNPHPVTVVDDAALLGETGESATIISSHRQAVSDPGAMRVIARATDETIEAVIDDGRPFYLGVQWHPERGGDDVFSRRLFERLVRAAGAGGA